VIATNDFNFRQMRRQMKDKKDVEIQTSFMSYKPTHKMLPIKINLNNNIGLHSKSLYIEVHNIAELEWPI